MNFKQLKKQIKEEQKQLAVKITRGKIFRKPSKRSEMTDDDKKVYCYNYNGNFTFDILRLVYSSTDYRHRHIAYCMFFNKTPYERIERDTKTPPNKNKINMYIKEWEKSIDEIVCNNP